MSDTDYSDDYSDDGPPTHIVHGQSQDPGLLLHDALAKVKHWKSKYNKCNRDKVNGQNTLKETNLKIKDLMEIKVAHDKLKVDCDVDKRNFEMRIANEAEKVKKYQELLKQSKTSLEDMTKRHRDIADLNKQNEAKLFQTKIEYAGVVSGVASFEEQITELKEEMKSSKEQIGDQMSTIHSLSSEKSSIQKDNELLKERCKELSKQLNEFRSLCEKLDTKYADLAQEHISLKSDSQSNATTLTKSVNDYKEGTLLLTKERDALTLNLSHTRETLTDTQSKLEELQELYKTEKSTADENSVLLKQAEMSILHLKELYTEKETQLKKQTTDLEGQLVTLRKELDETRSNLRESQLHFKSLEDVVKHEQHTADKIAKDQKKEKDAIIGEMQQLAVQNKGLNDIICELRKTNEDIGHNYAALLREANQKIETLSCKTSEQRVMLSTLEAEKERLHVEYENMTQLSAQSDNTISKLNEEIIITRDQQSSLQEQLNKSLNQCEIVEDNVNKMNETLGNEKYNWESKEHRYTELVRDLKGQLSDLREQISESERQVDNVSQENSTLKNTIDTMKKEFEEERESFGQSYENLTVRNRELEYEVFEVRKSHEERGSRHAAKINACRQKVESLDNKIAEQATLISELQSENNELLVKLEGFKINCAHYESTILRLTQQAETKSSEKDGLCEELNQSVNKCEAEQIRFKQICGTIENEKIKWSGKECRYLNEIRGLESSNNELKVRLEELTLHYKTEIKELNTKHEQQHSLVEEDNTQKFAVLATSMKKRDNVLLEYQDIIRHATIVIQKSLTRLTSTYNSCNHLVSQRGGQTVSSTNTEQIAALNTELGHLTATSDHLKEKIKQLEDEKQQDIQRFEKLNEERNQLLQAKNDIEIEMGKQRDVFKEEIRNMKNDMKNNENKHEVLRKKLEGSRDELAKMEHELRGLQTNLADKTNANDRLTDELGAFKTDNNVLSHQLNELKTASEEQVTEIENLKTRITVIQEDNKNIRLKSEESLQRVKEKDVSFKEIQDKLTESQQKLHGDQIKHIEEIGAIKEELQEKIYGLESEIKQVKYERDNKESQLVSLRSELSKRADEKVASSTAAPVPVGISKEAATQYRELFDKHSAQQTEIQQLRSDKIILDNSATQLKFNLETEREKLAATEKAMKDTTDILNDTKNKIGDLQTQYNKANNDILRLEELLRVEKERYGRLTQEVETERTNTSRLSASLGSFKDQVDTLKEQIKQEISEKATLEKEVAEKERMLSSEAKLRLHITSQMSSNSNLETALENERRKVDKLEEKCEALADQVDKLKASLEDAESSRKKLRDELEETTRSTPNVSQYEDKVKALKQKVATDRETAKKTQEELTRKVKKSQTLAKEEASQRKELIDKYIALKSDIGEVQGKMAVLLAENERLKSQYETIERSRDNIAQEKADIEGKILTDYILRSEVEMSKKSLEARNRVELNRKLHEMNQKLDHDNKSREAIDKFKAATESKIREDMEKTNRQLKQKITDCYEQFGQHDKQLASVQHENEKLKQILSEERRTMERLLPSFAPESVVPPLSIPVTPRTPFRQCDNSNIRATQDANATWQLMKSKLNESLNKFIVEQEVSPESGTRSPGQVTPGRTTPGRTTPGRVTPRRVEIGPDPARTSADSFL